MNRTDHNRGLGRFLHRNWRKVLVSAGIALLLQAGDYFLTNVTYPLFDSVDALLVFDYLAKRGDAPDEEMLYLNVGYDKALVPATDAFGDTIGVIPVTDRKLLAEFLAGIKDADYRYLFVDIRFEADTGSEDDSLLFSAMAGLDRFSFSTHRGEDPLVPDSLLSKSAYSDFRGNFRDGFTRYEFLQSGHESSALRMYATLYGKEMKRKGPLFLLDGRLAYNMLFVPFYLNDASSSGGMGLVKYPYLGYEMKKDPALTELKERAKGKIVVVGDFENDWHQTYIGDVPGPILTVRAFQCLEAGAGRFSWICFGLTFCLYFIVLLLLLDGRDVTERICRRLKIKSAFLAYLLTFLGWGLALSLLKIILYAAFGVAVVVFLPAAAFSTISFINKIKQLLRKQIPQ